jgi:hypothetical protein
MTEINPLWDEFIMWLAQPEHERGTVATEDEWAKAHGYSDARTLRRWKNKPEFIERQRKLTEKLVTKIGGAIVTSDDDVLDSEERDYRLVKSKLVQSAKEGNLKAQELYMKQYGKSWIDEEQASRSSDFTNLELPALVARAASALEPEILAEALRVLGYKVEKGAD